jgi:hypothetical protein
VGRPTGYLGIIIKLIFTEFVRSHRFYKSIQFYVVLKIYVILYSVGGSSAHVTYCRPVGRNMQHVLMVHPVLERAELR